jgi:hypothetical protein
MSRADAILILLVDWLPMQVFVLWLAVRYVSSDRRWYR